MIRMRLFIIFLALIFSISSTKAIFNDPKIKEALQNAAKNREESQNHYPPVTPDPRKYTLEKCKIDRVLALSSQCKRLFDAEKNEGKTTTIVKNINGRRVPIIQTYPTVEKVTQQIFAEVKEQERKKKEKEMQDQFVIKEGTKFFEFEMCGEGEGFILPVPKGNCH